MNDFFAHLFCSLSLIFYLQARCQIDFLKFSFEIKIATIYVLIIILMRQTLPTIPLLMFFDLLQKKFRQSWLKNAPIF